MIPYALIPRLLRLRASLLALTCCLGSSGEAVAQPPGGYRAYHQQIIQAEELIARRQFAAALEQFERTIGAHDYVFLRDYQVAIQLALYLQDYDQAFGLVRGSVAAGWTWRQIRRNPWLKPLRRASRAGAWRSLRADYAPLRGRYEQTLNHPLRAQVQAMIRQDQRLALLNLLKPSQQASERFLHRVFAPHSERQLARLRLLLQQHGYPGEKLVGNGSWMTTILSHHNSISVRYARQDTLYPQLRPFLLQAIERGELAPAEYAVFDGWYVAVQSDRQQEAYGYLNPLTEQELPLANARRQRLGLRSVELRNALVAVEEQTGMDLGLDGVLWAKGRIRVVPKR